MPIVLDGTNRVVRKGWLMNWRNCITIRVLPPVSAQDVKARDVKDVMAEVHDNMVAALADIRAKA